MTGHSLLAVFAHPDDESIACGGLLARCSDMGVRVSLICVTRGEGASQQQTLGVERLKAERTRELEEASRVLGISELVFLDYEDGCLPWVNAEAFVARLREEMRRIRPEIVVTFGDDGLYWHPDHIAVYERTTAAVVSLGGEAPALYHVTLPHGMIRRVVDELDSAAGSENGTRPVPEVLGIADPDAFGADARPPTLRIDVGPWAVRKLAALRCHHTQVDGSVLTRISDEAAPRLLGMETFHRAPIGASGDVFLEQMAIV